MKVKELIKKLKEFDENEEVVLAFFNTEYNEWQDISVFVASIVEQFKKKQTFHELAYIAEYSDLADESIILWGY